MTLTLTMTMILTMTTILTATLTMTLTTTLTMTPKGTQWAGARVTSSLTSPSERTSLSGMTAPLLLVMSSMTSAAASPLRGEEVTSLLATTSPPRGQEVMSLVMSPGTLGVTSSAVTSLVMSSLVTSSVRSPPSSLAASAAGSWTLVAAAAASAWGGTWSAGAASRTSWASRCTPSWPSSCSTARRGRSLGGTMMFAMTSVMTPMMTSAMTSMMTSPTPMTRAMRTTSRPLAATRNPNADKTNQEPARKSSRRSRQLSPA
ncbi:hypothetical protein Q9966_016666 [Columba livia]|nr:hypothetical protein Q9966_016666 [Columba livia]